MEINKVIIIAEAGVNHNGDMDLAKKMIDVAVEAGVDIVKFQTFKAELLVTKNAKKANYQIENTGSNDSQFNMLKALELDRESHYLLLDYCQSQNIEFLSTAFDLDSLDFLRNLGLKVFKIPSGELTNLPYLRKVGSYNTPVILSTGMAELLEIEVAIEVLVKAGTDRTKITILHCNTEYPTPMADVNLRAMLTIRDTLNVPIGYSDHTLGIEVPIAAVALGATIIEKHFTLDKNMVGPDHKASLEPEELKKMVEGIRNIELALGSNIKTSSLSESKNKEIARKSIHIAKPLIKGHILTEIDLVMKRPGDGISPMLIDQIIGKTIQCDMEMDQKLQWQDLN
jgi:N,N'-diacetyllegionaminate synthase